MGLADTLNALAQGDGLGPVKRALSRWDGVITPEAVETVNAQRLKDLGGSRLDGTGRFRGSLLGSCDRMQMLSYLGYIGAPSDSVGEEIMRDGTYRHYLWQEVGLSAGFLTRIEARTWNETRQFGGQLDGLMPPEPGSHIPGGFELKTTNSKKFKEVKERGRPFDKHLAQIGAYCESMGLEWFSVVYEVRSFQVDWHEFVVRYDDELKALVDATFSRLHAYRDAQVLPPIKENYPNDNECKYWCAFTNICPRAEY